MVKLLKASIMDDLKYNRYDDIAEAAQRMSDTMAVVDREYFMDQLVLIFEQVVQRLVRSLPSAQLKLSSPGVQNILQRMKALLMKSSLPLPDQLSMQLNKLVVIFTVDDKTILPNEVLTAIEAIRKPSDDLRLFHVMNNLSQGHVLLTEAETNAKKRMSSESSLLELGEVTNALSQQEGVSSDQMEVDSVMKLWDQVKKLHGDLKEKPEAKNVIDLETRLHKLSDVCIKNHAASELGAHIASQCVHGKNKMKCLDLPNWKILPLRQYIPDDSLFRLG